MSGSDLLECAATVSHIKSETREQSTSIDHLNELLLANGRKEPSN